MTIALTLQRYLAASVVATLAKTALFWFLVAIALICAIWAARAQQSSTAEAERYIKESESQWAESVANGDASVVERILAHLLRSRPYLRLACGNMVWGRSAITSQALMRWRVALQFIALCLVMAALYLSVK